MKQIIRIYLIFISTYTNYIFKHEKQWDDSVITRKIFRVYNNIFIQDVFKFSFCKDLDEYDTTWSIINNNFPCEKSFDSLRPIDDDKDLGQHWLR